MQRKLQETSIPGYILPANTESSAPLQAYGQTSLGTVFHRKRGIDEEDITADVSEITSEIDKISKCMDNPEAGLKDANRLLKEIDEQMEISFEIMEERQTMVRSYLIEREKEEKTHKNRADKIMADFANKMEKLEVITNQTPLCTNSHITFHGYDKLSKFSQTNAIVVTDGEIQTTSDIIEEKNLQEAIEVLSVELKEAYARQLVCEKNRFHAKLKRKDFDIETLTLFDIEALLLETSDLDTQKLVETFVDEAILNETKDEFKVAMEREKSNICEFLVNEGNECLQIKNDDLLLKLISTKNDFLQKRKFFKEVMKQKKENEKMNELRVVCRHLDAAEAVFSEKISNLTSELTVHEETLKNLVERLININDEQRNHQLDKFIAEYVCMENKGSDHKHHWNDKIKELCCSFEEIKHKEEELNTLLFSKFANPNKEMLRNCLKHMKRLLSKEQDSQSDSGIENPVPVIYTSLNDSFRNLCESGYDIETIRDKIGENLVKDLLRSEGSADEVCDIVRYQDRFLEDILQDYADEIEKTEKEFYQVNAINEVYSVLCTKSSTKEAVETLQNELEKANQELKLITISNEKTNKELKVLKCRKDEILTHNSKIVKNRNNLCRNLKDLNKTIADKLLTEKRKKEISEAEMNICQLQKQIDILEGNRPVSKDEIFLTLEKNEIDGKNLLNEKLSRLKSDWNKLLPYTVHLNDAHVQHTLQKLPTSEEVEKIVSQRNLLSEILVRTENKIQDIIMQTSGAACQNESLDNMMDFGYESPKINHRELNCKLISLETELEKINCQIAQITVHKDLKTVISEEMTLNATNGVVNPIEMTKQLGAVKKDMAVIKKKLREKKLSQDLKHDENKIKQLFQAKLNLEKQMHEIKKASVKNYSEEIIRDAMRELLQEKDRTENIVLRLGKDLENMKEVESKMSHFETCEKKLIAVEKDILKKKEDCVIKMVAMAKKDHHHFVESIKKEIETKMNNQMKEENQGKEKPSAVEKEKLRNELRDIINDMKQTREELKEIHQFQKTGHAKDNALLITLSEKKEELLATLNQVNVTIEKEILASTNQSLVTQLVQKKEDIIFQLEDLKERISNQEDVLKERYKKLLGIKDELESKISDGMDIEELQQIIFQIENPKMDSSSNQNEVTSLFKKRLSVQNEITKLLAESPLNKVALREASKNHDEIDTSICTRLDEMMAYLHENNSEEENISYQRTVFLYPELYLEIARQNEELANTLRFASPEKVFSEEVSDECLQYGAQEIRQLEDIKYILDDFHNRNIEGKNISDIILLKSLNEEKIERLVSKIKTLNVVMDTQKRQNNNCTEPSRIVEEKQSSETRGIIKNSNESENRNPNKNLILLSNSQATESISNLLLYRDDLLNLLFCVEKKIENKIISNETKKELLIEKIKIEKDIDEVDQKILEGDFIIPNSDLEYQSSSRSFSPRSTSSQVSISDVFVERDQLTKNLFKIKMKEERLKKNIISYEEDWAELATTKDQTKKSIKQLDAIVLNEDSMENDVTLVKEIDEEYLEAPSVNVLQMEILSLNEQLKDEVLSPVESVRQSISKASHENPINPSESEILSSISDIDEQISIENLKLQLHVLHKQKKEIENIIKNHKLNNCDVTEQIGKSTKPNHKDIEKKFQLMQEKCRLENEIADIKEKIEKNEILLEKTEQIEFFKIEQKLTFQENKEKKESLELQIDILDNLINQYSSVIENEIKFLENQQVVTKQDSASVFDSLLNEGSSALKSFRGELEDFVAKATHLGKKAAIQIPLKNLLIERKQLVSSLEKLENQMGVVETRTELQEITEEIRESYKKCKELSRKENGLHAKIKVFEKKLQDILEEAQSNTRVKFKNCLMLKVDKMIEDIVEEEEEVESNEKIDSSINSNKNIVLDFEEQRRVEKTPLEKELYETIENLKKEKSELEFELASFQDQLKDIDSLKKEILQYKEEIKEKNRLDKENNAVKTQLEIFRKHLEENEKSKEKLQNDVIEQINTNKRLLEENKTFKEELDFLAQLIQVKKEKILPNGHEIPQQTKDQSFDNETQLIFEKEVEEKEKENEQVLTLKKTFETKIEEMEEYIKLLEQNNNNLKDELAQKSLLNSDSKGENELLAVNECFNNMQTNNNSIADALTLKISEQNDSIKALLQEKEELSEYLNHLEDDHAMTVNLLDSNSSLLRQLKHKLGWDLYHLLINSEEKTKHEEKEMCDSFSQQLNELLKNSSMEELLQQLLLEVNKVDEKIRISDLEAEIELKNAKIQSMEKNLHDDGDLIKNLELKNEALEKHLVQLSDRVEYQSAKENDVYIKMIGGLEKQLRMVSETNQSMEESSVKDNEKISQLKHENKILKQKNVHLDEHIEVLKKKEEDLYSDIQRLREDLRNSGKKSSESANEINKLKEEQIKLLKNLEEVSDENKKLRVQISTNENAEESAKSTLRKLSVEVKKLKFELADSAADIESLNQEKQQLKLNNDSLCKKLQQSHKQKNDLQNRLDEQNKNLGALREEIMMLKEGENAFKFELRDKHDIIEEQQQTIAKLGKSVQDTEKQIDQLRQEFLESKEMYQALSLKYQTECDKYKDELRSEKSIIEEMKTEIEMLTRLKDEADVVEKNLKNQNAENRREHLQRESQLLIDIESERKRNQELKDSIDDYLRKTIRLETRISSLKEENESLIEKINNLDEKYEEELSDMRKTMNETFNSNVDNLNKKLRKMATDYMNLDQINESLTNANKQLTIEKEDLLDSLNTQIIMHKESQAFEKAKIASLTSEIEGLRLENSDIKEQIDEMKLCTKKAEVLKMYEQELNERKLNLDSAYQHLEEEKVQFTESIENHLKKIHNEKTSKQNEERVNKESISLKMLASCQDQRDKLSDDLTKLKYELNNTKMELRKANLALRDKEQFHASEEKMLIKKFEEEMQHKIEEMKRNIANEKSSLIKIQNEERMKWEEEMKMLAADLHEENLRKLAEQKADFEKELQEQIFKFFKENSEEIAELITKNEQLQKDKSDLQKQMDEEKLIMIQEHARQHFVWEDTVRRLLTNLIQLKEKQATLRHKHQSEIVELENKITTEKERLEKRHFQEVENLKENLHKIYANTINKEKQFLQSTLEEIVNEVAVVKYGPIRMQPERDEPVKLVPESCSDSLSSGDLDISIAELTDLISADADALCKKNFTNSKGKIDDYELKLCRESDNLVKRLLKLSDALETIRKCK